MDDFVIEKISRGMLIVSLNGHEISFEGEMFFPNNEFHFSLYAKTAKFTKTNQILSKEELDNNLESNKIVSIDWNALNGDAEGKPYTLNEMIDYVKRTSRGKNQVVLLMHDTFGKEKTVKILPEIIKYYKEEGYEFKTISDANV